MAALIVTILGIIAVGLACRAMLKRPQWVAKVPAVTGIILGLGVFFAFTHAVRPVAQSEAFFATALGAGLGILTWRALRRAINPWLERMGAR